MAFWELPTNFSNGTIADGVGKFFIKYPSYILHDYFGIGITLMVFIFTFALSLVSGSRKAFMVASFMSFAVSIYFVRLGVINLAVSMVLIIFTIIGALGSQGDGGGI